MISTVLIATDDRAVASLLQSALETDGITLLCADTAEEVVALLDSQEFDLVILQLDLRGMAAAELASVSRQRTPAIMLLIDTIKDTAKASDESAGEMHQMILDSRTGGGEGSHGLRMLGTEGEALCSMHEDEGAHCLTLGDLTLHLDRHAVTVGEHCARLTPMQARILRVLIEHSPRVVSPELLVERVRLGGEADLSQLAAGIASLRAALGDDPLRPSRIRHFAAYGYCIWPLSES